MITRRFTKANMASYVIFIFILMVHQGIFLSKTLASIEPWTLRVLGFVKIRGKPFRLTGPIYYRGVSTIYTRLSVTYHIPLLSNFLFLYLITRRFTKAKMASYVIFIFILMVHQGIFNLRL